MFIRSWRSWDRYWGDNRAGKTVEDGDGNVGKTIQLITQDKGKLLISTLSECKTWSIFQQLSSIFSFRKTRWRQLNFSECNQSKYMLRKTQRLCRNIFTACRLHRSRLSLSLFLFFFCLSFSFSFCSLMLAEMTEVWMAWVPQFSSSRYTKTWFHNRRRKTRSYQQTADWQRNWEINWKYWNRKWVSWDWYVLSVQMSNLPIIPLVRC